MPITLTTSLASGGTATFGVFSPYGAGTAHPDGYRASNEINDGDVIEAVAPLGLTLFYDDVSGTTNDDDLRRLTFTTDFSSPRTMMRMQALSGHATGP